MKYSQQQLEFGEVALSFLIGLFLCCIPPGDARFRKESCNTKYSLRQESFWFSRCRVPDILLVVVEGSPHIYALNESGEDGGFSHSFVPNDHKLLDMPRHVWSAAENLMNVASSQMTALYIQQSESLCW